MNESDARLITEIERIREANNRRWMDLVRLAFEVAPSTARSIMQQIVEHDQHVSALMRELAR